MAKRITIIDGHPDADGARYCHALAKAYAEGAQAAGHEVKTLKISDIEFPILRTSEEWTNSEPPQAIRQCQDAIAWAGHLVVIYPLWLGSMPALLKAFFEQIGRPGFAIAKGRRPFRSGLLTGRSARVIVTMGMPSFIYRWFYLAHSLRSFERNVLRMCGLNPIHDTIIGNVEGQGQPHREGWLERMRAMGKAAK
jgi:putative NADPH-quinone reductase